MYIQRIENGGLWVLQPQQKMWLFINAVVNLILIFNLHLNFKEILLLTEQLLCSPVLVTKIASGVIRKPCGHGRGGGG